MEQGPLHQFIHLSNVSSCEECCINRRLTDLRRELALLTATGLTPRSLALRTASDTGGIGAGTEAGSGDIAVLQNKLSIERQLRGRLEQEVQVSPLSLLKILCESDKISCLICDPLESVS